MTLQNFSASAWTGHTYWRWVLFSLPEDGKKQKW